MIFINVAIKTEGPEKINIIPKTNLLKNPCKPTP